MRRTQNELVSGFTLIELLTVLALLVPVEFGLMAGAGGGIAYALFGFGLGVWFCIGMSIFVYRLAERFQNKPLVVFLTFCIFLVLSPFLIFWTVNLVVTNKPIPSLIIAMLGVLSTWDAYHFVKRQSQRAFQAETCAKTGRTVKD